MELASVYSVKAFQDVKGGFGYGAQMHWSDRLNTRLRDLTMSPADLSRESGLPYDSIAKYVSGKVDQPRRQALEKLATAVRTTASWLMHGEQPSNGQMLSEPVRLGGNTIPLYGTAIGGEDGQFILNGNKVEDLMCPPALSGVPNAYAVAVAGESMEPRYYAGEVVYVHPTIPVRKGQFVVAQVVVDEQEPPYAFIKRFIAMNTHLVLESLNPIDGPHLLFPRHQVQSVHRILMSGDY